MAQAKPTAAADDEQEQLLLRLRPGWFGFWARESHWLLRFVFLRGLGLIYFAAFLSLALQLRGLIGREGILPAAWFLDRLRAHPDAPGLWRLPTLFWLNASDGLLVACAWLGVLLSAAVLAGFANAPLLAGLWFLYMSFVHVGQIFYGYGWEMLLLETGFLAIFFAPPKSLHPLSTAPPPALVVWLLRWLVFRLMFGAGLIKIRGDACWTDLTCLVYHYETQPNPNPLSWWLHQAPPVFHKAGVLFNHFVELIAPWGVFGPKPVRHASGVVLILFQLMLILSGNLSFLNWLTIVACLSCFDDTAFLRLLPEKLRARARATFQRLDRAEAPSKARRLAILAVVSLVCVLSLNPIVNMLSPVQAMNASFDPLHLVNTYGAFGSVGKERHEVVIEGTSEQSPGAHTRWQEYEFPCKPGNPTRRPCLVGPYQHRLDWQMWFLALGTIDREPWFLHLSYRLLQGNDAVEALLLKNPFHDRPPRYVRALYYRYRFTRGSIPRGSWWKRELVGEYIRPVSIQDPDLREFLARRGWLAGS